MAPVVGTANLLDRLVAHKKNNLVVLMGEDNPAFEGVFEFCSISAGGSICTATSVSLLFF